MKTKAIGLLLFIAGWPFQIFGAELASPFECDFGPGSGGKEGWTFVSSTGNIRGFMNAEPGEEKYLSGSYGATWNCESFSLVSGASDVIRVVGRSGRSPLRRLPNNTVCSSWGDSSAEVFESALKPGDWLAFPGTLNGAVVTAQAIYYPYSDQDATDAHAKEGICKEIADTLPKPALSQRVSGHIHRSP